MEAGTIHSDHGQHITFEFRRRTLNCCRNTSYKLYQVAELLKLGALLNDLRCCALRFIAPRPFSALVNIQVLLFAVRQNARLAESFISHFSERFYFGEAIIAELVLCSFIVGVWKSDGLNYLDSFIIVMM